ncbi:MAG: tetratricopeptide repeat protein, partial [Methanothrix sp.]|nr:tetratricopeptide repeat protein [Methanothrix sp.]
GILWVVLAALNIISVSSMLSSVLPYLLISTKLYLLAFLLTILVLLLAKNINFLQQKGVVVTTIVSLLFSLTIICIKILIDRLFNNPSICFLEKTILVENTILGLYIILLISLFLLYDKQIREFIKWFIFTVLTHEMLNKFISIFINVFKGINPFIIPISVAINYNIIENILDFNLSIPYKIYLIVVILFLTTSFLIWLEHFCSVICLYLKMSYKTKHYLAISVILISILILSWESSLQSNENIELAIHHYDVASNYSVNCNDRIILNNIESNYTLSIYYSRWARIFNIFNPISCEIQGNAYRRLGKINGMCSQTDVYKIYYYNLSIKYYDNAISMYDIWPRWYRNSSTVWNNKGIAFAGLQRYDDAIECYDKAIELKPDFAEAWNNKGIAFAGLQRYDDAIECYDKAI